MDSLQPLTVRHAVLVVLVAFASLFVFILVKGFRTRLIFYRLRQQGMVCTTSNFACTLCLR